MKGFSNCFLLSKINGAPMKLFFILVDALIHVYESLV